MILKNKIYLLINEAFFRQVRKFWRFIYKLINLIYIFIAPFLKHLTRILYKQLYKIFE